MFSGQLTLYFGGTNSPRDFFLPQDVQMWSPYLFLCKEDKDALGRWLRAELDYPALPSVIALGMERWLASMVALRDLEPGAELAFSDVDAFVSPREQRLFMRLALRKIREEGCLIYVSTTSSVLVEAAFAPSLVFTTREDIILGWAYQDATGGHLAHKTFEEYQEAIKKGTV